MSDVTQARPPTGSGRMLPVLRQQSFQRLLAGQCLSFLGDGISVIAFAWVTIQLTGSTVALGAVLAAQAIPRAALTAVGGVLSDRMSPRLLMVLSSGARAVLMTGVGGLSTAGALSFTWLIVLAASFGVVDGFFQPARGAILPSVVDTQHFEAANGMLLAGSRLAGIGGPALGGILVASAGTTVAFFTDAACLVLCTVAVALVKPRGSEAGRQLERSGDRGRPRGWITRFGRDLREGARYAWADPRIRTMLLVDTVVTFCYAGPFAVGFVALARERFGGSASALGFLDAGLAFGAVGGSLLAARVRRSARLGLLVVGLVLTVSAGCGALAIVAGVVPAVATAMVIGFAIGFQGVFAASWIQRSIAPNLIGRVVSLDMTAGYAITPLSMLLAGALAGQHLTTLFLLTAAVLAVTGAGALLSGSVRSMR